MQKKYKLAPDSTTVIVRPQTFTQNDLLRSHNICRLMKLCNIKSKDILDSNKSFGRNRAGVKAGIAKQLHWLN